MVQLVQYRRNHEQIADALEERAGAAAPEQRDPRAHEYVSMHRATAARLRRLATIDQDAAEMLRRDAWEPGGDGERVAD